MDNVCLIGGLRSYIGLTGGVYRHVPAELLGAAVLKAVTEKYNVVPQQIICGNGVGAGGNIYLDAVDDTNSIHRGENPVVPGLCMIEHLWRALNKPLPLNWDVKFKMPAFAGEQIDIYKNGASLDGYCGGRELFTVGIKES
jgi:hypothetical protein